MLTRSSPTFTREPSRKCTDCTAPATRERTSTRSTASRRPEKSSQVATSACTTVATMTGVGGGSAPGEAAFELRSAKTPAVSAVAAKRAATAVASRRLRGRKVAGIFETPVINVAFTTDSKERTLSVAPARVKQFNIDRYIMSLAPGWGVRGQGPLAWRQSGFARARGGSPIRAPSCPILQNAARTLARAQTPE